MISFYVAGKHELDETRAECDFCLTEITDQVSHVHVKLTSAAINNNCYSKPICGGPVNLAVQLWERCLQHSQ